jgi:1-acyl-sn-glycerol-3-phosphate acyltransferase
MLTSTETETLAWVILVLLVAALVGTATMIVRRSNYTAFQYIFYAYAVITARVLWRGQVPTEVPNFPTGGAIIVGNHRSSFDPVFIQLIAGRVVHWMVAREYCENLAMGWFLRITECIPVSRGGVDTGSTISAIRYAESGELVGMFPEGKLNTTEALMLPGRRGAAMVALRARVPIVPCYISEAPVAHSILACLYKPAHTRLIVGQPIDTSPYYEQAKERDAQIELTSRIMHEIAKLAGQNDFQPQHISGR